MKILFPSLALVALLATATSAQTPASTPTLQRFTTPPPLTPLAFTLNGRALVTPSTSGDKDYATQWPGAYFQAAFKGSELFFTLGPSHEILHLVVDTQVPIVLTDPAPGTYSLSGLTARPHAVSLYIVSESQSAPNHFGGFALSAASKPLPPPTASRQIEFIGDSHTVGFGNTSPSRECTSSELYAHTDNTLAFGPLTAAHFHAAYQINAISGHGIVRNYNGSPGDPVPVAYPFTLLSTAPDKPQSYADPLWRPEILVVSLGTNDFSTPLNPGEPWHTRDDLHADFEATYLRFVQTLRARNPNAYIILWSTETFDGEIASEVQKVVAQAKARGEIRLTFLPMDNLAFTGCFYHPSAADDQVISDKLIHFIDATPGIWQNK